MVAGLRGPAGQGMDERLLDRMESPRMSPQDRLLDPMCSPLPSPGPSPPPSPGRGSRPPQAHAPEPRGHPKEPEASLFSSWCVLTNTLLGVGILGLPWAISSVGLGLGGLMMAAAGGIAAFALHLLADIVVTMTGGSQGPAEVSFYSVCIQASPRARYVVDVAIALKCFGVATSYLQVIGQLGTSLAVDAAIGFDGLSVQEVRCGIIALVLVAVIMPSVFHKRITKTAAQNMLAIGSWLYVASLAALAVLGILPTPGAAESSWRFEPPEGMGFQAVATAVPVFIFSFTCHQNLFPIATELRGRTRLRLDIMLGGAILTGLLIYCAAGLGAYLQFGGAVRQNFLLNLPLNGPVLLGRCLVIMAVVFTYPLQLHPCRRSLMILAESARGTFFTRREERILRRVLTVCILLGTLAVAASVNDLGLTLAFVGAVGSNTVVLIMPPFMYLRLHGHRGALRLPALGLFVLGCAILPTCLTGIVLKLIDAGQHR
mmetsp:Transcript_21306/g.61573  ORF Transcript_21306/g.61573 Transcript_21306/m.61573 type:complete len:487 (+) Transcript_21306:85-1545(+)